MSGNSFGKIFKVTTFGESHGDSIGCIVDGCPPGLELCEEYIQTELDKRKPGKNKFVSQRRESDTVQILSGVFDGVTLGTPITLLIKNEDQKSKDYNNVKNVFRPGHGDYTYFKKYGIYDYRGGGRASARETATRVAAGAIAKKYLQEHFGIKVQGYLASVGKVKPEKIEKKYIKQNEFFYPASSTKEIEEYISLLRKRKTSVGAKAVVEAFHVPSGLGEPVFDKLDAKIAYALMGIGAVKAVAIGDGFDCDTSLGHEFKDEIYSSGFASNKSGGVLAGISTGQTISASVLLKPTSSIPKTCNTINKENEEVKLEVLGRHDPCVGIRVVPILEAMMALVLIDFVFLHEKNKKKEAPLESLE